MKGKNNIARNSYFLVFLCGLRDFSCKLDLSHINWIVVSFLNSVDEQ